jgi:hypothetical protein
MAAIGTSRHHATVNALEKLNEVRDLRPLLKC